MEKELNCALSLLFLLILSLLITITLSAPRAQVVEFTCGTQREHNTTQFIPNFVATMENISDMMRTAGFGQIVVGSGPDANYGLAQCYGDLSLLDCVLCYAEARTLLPQCFPFNSGRIYLDGCFMRVENYTFFDEIKGPGDKAVCGNRTRKSLSFQDSVRRAVREAAVKAPGNGGYARAVAVAVAVNESAYVLANCWRTLNSSACKACLDNATAEMVGKCLPWSEGRALRTGCFMRYSDTNFFNEQQRGGSDSKVSVKVVVVIVVSSVAVLVIGVVIGLYIAKQRRLQRKRKGLNCKVEMAKTLHSSLKFEYSTLQKATGSFSDENKLGQGGFGTVYKGVLADGREIAVKRLFFNNRHRAADFFNEVNIISGVQHKNLVRLLGCSCFGPESLLVYEFLPNQSLDRFIFDPNRGKVLNWEKRFEIIIGMAEGLAYLHENSKIRIIHRDIKASNILLDARLKAKIADFGLARTFQEDKSHISTAIAGTLGYMAPEYLAHGQLTEKADVYSFGIVLLEIVTGIQNNKSKNSEFSESLVVSVWKQFQKGTVENLFDPNMMLNNFDSESNIEEVLRVVHVGLLCTQEISQLRPSMSRVLKMLSKNEEQLARPTNPPFIDERTMALNDTFDYSSYPLNSDSSPSAASISHSIFFPR